MRASAPGRTSRGARVGPGANGIKATARILASGVRRGATATNALASRPSTVVAMPFAPGPTRRSTAAAAADATNPRRSDPPSSPSPSVVDATDDASVAFANLRPKLHPKLLAALHRAGFVNATPLQTRAVPAALDASPDGATQDVVVAAETGSGKTLAYLVPVFSNLLFHGHGADDGADGDEAMSCLLYTSPSPRDRQKSRMPSSA